MYTYVYKEVKLGENHKFKFENFILHFDKVNPIFGWNFRYKLNCLENLLLTLYQMSFLRFCQGNRNLPEKILNF
jgi:hypothetical protein